jgi:AbrB family looped-hinge helix DNA binding protein
MSKSLKASATTLTSKGQLTVPAAIATQLGLTRGTKIDVYPLPGKEGFRAVIRRPSRILQFAGDLKDWPRGSSEG